MSTKLILLFALLGIMTNCSGPSLDGSSSDGSNNFQNKYMEIENLSLTEQSYSVLLEWDYVEDAQKYYIFEQDEKRESSSIPYDSTYYSKYDLYDSDLSDGPKYYSIAAVDEDGVQGTKSELVSIIGSPNNLVVDNATSSYVRLTWDNISGISDYYIYRSISSYETYTLIDSCDNNNFSDTTVEPGSYYYYTISAKISGEEEYHAFMSDYDYALVPEITVDEAFASLAGETGGEVYEVSSAKSVPGAISEIILDHAKGGLDFVLLIDNTGSMGDDISYVKEAVYSLLDELPNGARVSVATFADKNEDEYGWYDRLDFTTDFSLVEEYISNIITAGGGDLPESVYDGIYKTIEELNWKSSSQRLMLVIGDAAPLTGSLTTYSENDILELATSYSLDVNIFPILIHI
jgi:hypothetical protein